MASPSSIQGAIPWRRCIRPHTLRLPTRRPLTTSPPVRQSNAGPNPLRSSADTRAREHALAQSRRSISLSAAGIAACAVAMYGVIHLDLFGLEKLEPDNSNNKKDAKTLLDGPTGFTGPDADTSASSPAMILQGPDGSTQVETGTSSVPYFPSTMRLPTRSSNLQPGDALPAAGDDGAAEEYQLLGLGIRTVSFLRIQVYVVGLYIATKDLPELQQRLVRTAVNPPKEVDSPAVVQPTTTGAGSVAFATSLVPGERDALKKLLLDEERGDAAWSAVLREGGLRMAWRVVPTRNTDFLHLRDGWVRGLAARAQKYTISPLPDTSSSSSSSGGGRKEGEFTDESFGKAVGEFKALFGGGGGGGKKSVSKGQTLVLVRDADGALEGLVQAEVNKPGMRFLGRVRDERISRLVWLNYLAGKNVSSDGARRNVVDGVMGVVERPVGTI